MKKVRVCIRGLFGLLGWRLAQAIEKNPDIKISTSIGVADKSLEKLFSSQDSSRLRHINLYLDEPHKVVEKINKEQTLFHFEPADQLNLRSVCDVVVDATAPGSRHKWDERYRHFGGPVIIQSGEYPYGRLLVPPLCDERVEGNVYRMGDCILSGLSPILASFKEIAERFRVHVLMQYGQKLEDYPTAQRIGATYLNNTLASEVKDGLTSIFPTQEIVIENLLQVPGQDYYTVTLHLDSKVPLSGDDVREMLRRRPRILVLPKGITSTYEIDHYLREEARSNRGDIPPITVYDDFDFGPTKTDIRIVSVLYSRLIAVLPNIDAIRILGRGMDPLEAMKMTDKYMGFNYLRR